MQVSQQVRESDMREKKKKNSLEVHVMYDFKFDVTSNISSDIDSAPELEDLAERITTALEQHRKAYQATSCECTILAIPFGRASI